METHWELHAIVSKQPRKHIKFARVISKHASVAVTLGTSEVAAGLLQCLCTTHASQTRAKRVADVIPGITPDL